MGRLSNRHHADQAIAANLCCLFHWLLKRMDQAGEGLQRQDAIAAPIHLPAAGQRLVNTGLNRVGHPQDLVVAVFTGLADVSLEVGIGV